MGRHLDADGARESAFPVVLTNGDEASGLANMLHQFIEQTLAESARKRALARGLRGEALFRAAEDESVCVQMAFRGDRVELRDCGVAENAAAAAITADFLTIAHLTSGSESPFGLLARRRLRARFRLRQLPFLLNMMRFMRSDDRAARTARVRRLWLAAAFALGAAVLVWLVVA